MLRIDFGKDDLNRLRVAGAGDFMWDVVLSLQLLQNRHAALVFDPWRQQVRERLAREGLGRMTRALMQLCPCAPFFPDFLTPGLGVADPDAGLDAVLSTPKRSLRQELAQLYEGRAMPAGARRLAAGGSEALHQLGAAVRRYHAVAVAPYRAAIDRAVGADRAARAEAALATGAEGLLAGYQPELTWRGDRLECGYPFGRDLELNGRPLTLIPSFFCARWPVTLAAPDLLPVLVHPLPLAPGWLLDADRESGSAKRLHRLLGRTRTQVLELLESPMSTTGIATALRLSPANASRHAAVLREAGLVSSFRDGHRMLHRRTALGKALLNGV
ncbi:MULTISPECIES: ArsR/SmtB family transcription factor [unclassified Streptomyces]|uniref:ArsR/SmtB family transcription factor n=1 Tax=unclassified Streptomyces TaxID=2593676 RepID=UPI0015877C98|nr:MULTISPECIES: winged helix-turn-helix domain-containing protein [unclassified Streptomyces]NUV68522.1 winged helix-turn-helix transcriptional regulator [Streptomyces sp. CAI-121]NUW00770.1 winged helix-turn-helix transcriptional regulator [Streptomyces sp. CAI 127]NUW14668.1 winged helix-turn-helix transcriptional regulator [Streptomyces sp. CAI-68]